MAFLEHDAGPIIECPDCSHPPISHLEDGSRSTCCLCAFIAMKAAEQGRRIPKVCTRRFQFRLTFAEREQAKKANKNSFDQRAICANPDCGCEWRAHWGYLCPSGDSLFKLLRDKDMSFLITH